MKRENREAAVAALIALFGGLLAVGAVILFSSADRLVCDTSTYLEKKCSAFEEVGNVDGTGEKVENPEIIYSISTTAEEEKNGLKALSLRTSEDDKYHYYRVVLESDGIDYKVVTKNDMTEEEAFEDRLVKH